MLCTIRWYGAHVEGNLHSRFLTQSQGGQDWRTLRNFVMTSTVYLELLSALKHMELENDIMRTDLEYSCGVLNMKYKKQLVEDAPAEVQQFLTWLQEGNINNTAHDWAKTEKYKGMLKSSHIVLVASISLDDGCCHLLN